MGWKDWSYARKGGVIGGILPIILLPIAQILYTFFTSGNFNLVCPTVQGDETCNIFIFLITSLLPIPLVGLGWISWILAIIGFTIGSGIGWLIGKIKSRKQSNQ